MRAGHGGEFGDVAAHIIEGRSKRWAPPIKGAQKSSSRPNACYVPPEKVNPQSIAMRIVGRECGGSGSDTPSYFRGFAVVRAWRRGLGPGLTCDLANAVEVVLLPACRPGPSSWHPPALPV